MKNYEAETTPEILKYLEKTFHPEDPVLIEIRKRSDKAGLPPIQVGSMDGLHLEVLARAIGAKKAVEIGTLGGYSGVHFLRGMGQDGKLYTFELHPHHAEVAKKSFENAGVSKQVEIHVGEAIKNLKKIEQDGPFDLVFIDADKTSYPAYLQWAERNLRVGGAVIGDNTLAFGMIADTAFESKEDRDTVVALQKFNSELSQSGRFLATLFPTGEGMTFAIKLR